MPPCDVCGYLEDKLEPATEGEDPEAKPWTPVGKTDRDRFLYSVAMGAKIFVSSETVEMKVRSP